MSSNQGLQQSIRQLTNQQVATFDFLPNGNLAERLITLVLTGVPAALPPSVASPFASCIRQLTDLDTKNTKVVVFGGGTGLSNIIGGDSRRLNWPQNPFAGIKQIFPDCHCIVCITDDGGSTGELLKDLPLVALGDLRHVLLAAIQQCRLIKAFALDTDTAYDLVAALHALFNYRFITRPVDEGQLLKDTGADIHVIPDRLLAYLKNLISSLFTDSRLNVTLDRPQCLGNLLIAAAIYRQVDPVSDSLALAASYQVIRTATIRGLAELCLALGMQANAVLPCTTTNAQLQVRYTNGVQVTGEHKSSHCRRGYPVDRVRVEFFREPFVQPEVIDLIQQADILIFAPGSLYTSIIPIMQAPGLVDAVRANSRAMKLLVANIWVQQGETDVARDAPDRKFHVSDLIHAYHRNIPGGVDKLFSHVITLDLGDIPGSVLQSYAIEDKAPIYLDRKKVRALGFGTIAVPVFSRDQLERRRIIQHDPAALTASIKVLYGLWSTGLIKQKESSGTLPRILSWSDTVHPGHSLPCLRYDAIVGHCRYLSVEQLSQASRFDQRLEGKERNWLMSRVIEIIWNHPDILIEHLQYIRGICMVDPLSWKRCQQWDNVFSFYDPQDMRIKIRRDQTTDRKRFEMAFLVALGQSLLGNYARDKKLDVIRNSEEIVGHLFCLNIREVERLDCFFDYPTLTTYLELARMCASEKKKGFYTRVINGDEGFTPPGLLFGLCYAWYLDNRFAANIEYKMSIMKNEMGDLIPEQARIFDRRRRLIDFFREHVFHHQADRDR